MQNGSFVMPIAPDLNIKSLPLMAFSNRQGEPCDVQWDRGTLQIGGIHFLAVNHESVYAVSMR